MTIGYTRSTLELYYFKRNTLYFIPGLYSSWNFISISYSTPESVVFHTGCSKIIENLHLENGKSQIFQMKPLSFYYFIIIKIKNNAALYLHFLYNIYCTSTFKLIFIY